MRKTQQKNPPKRKVGMVTEAERLNEHEKALHALARAKALERKYADRLVTRRTITGVIRALPYTMQRLEKELFHLQQK